MNSVNLMGRLGKDPVIKTVGDGVKICEFSIATDRFVKGNKKTLWHNIVAFNRTAELCADYLAKGREVAVTGEIDYDSYEKDGVTKYVTKIIANKVNFVSAGRDSSGKGETNKPATQTSAGNSQEVELPF